MFEIVYQDEAFIAINKPVDILVHRTGLDKGESRFALQELRNQTGQWVYPIHRLDKQTSGVLLFAKDQKNASLMGEAFRDHSIQKRYLCILRGYVDDSGCIDYPLAYEGKETKKEAQTNYHRLARTELNIPIGPYQTARYSLVLAEPSTGRRHQLRRHFKHIFHNIIGDSWYGDRDHNRYWWERLNMHVMFLHAIQLEFTHPVSSKRILVSASLPDHWSIMLEQMGWEPNLIEKALGANFS